MNDRPSLSLWGTILSCAEIALNIYQVVAENGRGLMIREKEAMSMVSDDAIEQGQSGDGFLHYEANSLEEHIAADELIKNGCITDPGVIAAYQSSEEMEETGCFYGSDFFEESGSFDELEL